MEETLKQPTTVRDLLDDAQEEILDERITRKRKQLKEWIREMEAARNVLAEMEKNFEAFLEEPLDGDVFGE